jgi:predicted  nucleic acid-binding Zn-ribbon protein
MVVVVFNNEENPHGLMSKFMTKFGDYVNQGITELRSGAAETDEFKNKYDYQGHLEREKERRDLFRQSMTEKDPEKKAELRQKKNAFRNNSEYAEARRALHKKEDADVNEYHNRPIEQGEIVNDGSDEFKELENLYNKIISIKGREGSKIEDQEQPDFLVKKKVKKLLEADIRMAQQP